MSMDNTVIGREIIKMLVEGNFFYAYFIQQFRRVVLEPENPLSKRFRTLSVNVTDELRPTLFVNRVWYESLPDESKVAVIIHEIHHVLNKHLLRKEERNHVIWNWAADTAINQYINNLPYGWTCPDCNVFVNRISKTQKSGTCPNCNRELLDEYVDEKGRLRSDKCEPLMPEGIKIGNKIIKMERNRPTEYYYDILRKNTPSDMLAALTQALQESEEIAKQLVNGGGDGEQEGKQNGNGNDDPNKSGKMPRTLDDHEGWETSTDNRELVHEKVKDITRKAKNEAESRRQGTLPGHLKGLIDLVLAHKTKNWKSELRSFVGQEEFAAYESTRKKVNKRFGVSFPGYKVRRKAHLVVACDSSGSVSDDEFAKFWREIQVMHSAGVSITVVDIDADIQDVYEFKRVPNRNKQVRRVGYGGTDFRPVFDLVAKKRLGNWEIKKKVDGIIYMTDGAGSYPERVPCPTIWVMVKNHSDWGWNPRIGRKIVMED